MATLENFRLVVFRAVAEQLSFRKAAEELYLTQPAVSLQIKALEEDLGVQLFERSGSHIALTAAGQVLLRSVYRTREILAEAEREIAALSGEHAGKLALGASTTIAQYVLPRLLVEFRAMHPRVIVTLLGGNTEAVVHAVEQQSVALGLIEGPPRSRDVRVQPFLVDELVLIVPAAHEWAERGSIAAGELADAPLLMRERGSGTRHVVELALEKSGLKRGSLHIAMEFDATEGIKSAVEAGLGVGFVSRWALAKDARLGSGFAIVEVDGVRVQRDLLIAFAAGPEPQGIAGEFRRFLLARTSGRTRRTSAAARDKKRK
ncbi:MAG: LysR substrate-binding domain-containing protein [Acidobacteriota bacterium]